MTAVTEPIFSKPIADLDALVKESQRGTIARIHHDYSFHRGAFEANIGLAKAALDAGDFAQACFYRLKADEEISVARDSEAAKYAPILVEMSKEIAKAQVNLINF